MNKQKLIQEIRSANKCEQYLAGQIKKRLPIHRSHWNIGKKNHELPIVYTHCEFTTNLSTLTKRTSENVNALKSLFDIDWFLIAKYRVEKEYEGHPQRHAFIVYGLWNNQLVTFYRKETKNRAAGQTNLYFGNGNYIQVYKLIRCEKLYNEYDNDEILKWLPVVKRLNKVVNDVKLQRIILMYA